MEICALKQHSWVPKLCNQADLDIKWDFPKNVFGPLKLLKQK